MRINRIKVYIFLGLFCVPVVGMAAERVNLSNECYEGNQKKLALILCGFREEIIGLPTNFGHMVVSKYAEKEILEREEFVQQIQYDCHVPVSHIFKNEKTYPLIDLLFLDKDLRCGILTMSRIDNMNRLLSLVDKLRQEVAEDKQLLDQMHYCINFPSHIARNKKVCCATDLLFLEDGQRDGVLTKIPPISRFASLGSWKIVWGYLLSKVKEAVISEEKFNQTKLVPRRLREKLFADSDSTVKVFKAEKLKYAEYIGDEFVTHTSVVQQRSFLEDKQLCIADK
jgi:hypothetical protein